ncbi:Nitrate ABC transporter, nitrate-binding protein [Caballeronia sordidicola]|uniref:Nitrate ABC transporter, nitrate-binding protein n=1 Tax=Caballeronia sordidicola TaxID=196367 RepID=A0A242N4X5_CABSO|nr:Nitrate ABC transporter, nitrate-binding protein [Caballeronia sordidicola]
MGRDAGRASMARDAGSAGYRCNRSRFDEPCRDSDRQRDWRGHAVGRTTGAQCPARRLICAICP